MHKIYLYLAILITCQLSAQNDAVIRPIMDFHVHHDIETPGGDWILEVNSVDKAFLIPSSYEEKDLDKRHKLHQELSDFIQKNSNRFIGYCGLNTSWVDAVDITVACLNLPGMKGVKIHSWSEQAPIQVEESKNKLTHVLNNIRDKKPIVLWHVLLSHEKFQNINQMSELQFLEKELETIVQIARSYPDITFILAHNLEGKGIDILSRLARDLENIYLEISLPYVGEFFLSLDPSFVEGWRQFGFNKLLFGSDMGFADKNEHKILSAAILGASLLSASEKRQILFENSIRLIRKNKLFP